MRSLKVFASIKSVGAFWHRLGVPKDASQAETPRLETEVEPNILIALLMRVEQCWHQLGETEPHWSVITDAKFKTDRIAETREDFYNSGAGDLSLFREAADRCGVALPLHGTCFELGCGVGRSTIWLAKSFQRVIGADISSAHLALAEQVVRNDGYHNVELRLVNRLDAFDQLPRFDSFFSVICESARKWDPTRL